MRSQTDFPRVVHHTSLTREQTNNNKCRNKRHKQEEEE
jgi:hypothetical protein